MANGHIDYSWEQYAEASGYEAKENVELREAFFAGATILYGLLMGNLEDKNEDEYDAMMLSIHNELKSTAQKMFKEQLDG